MANLPWTVATPLMLAPMQGITNRALRAVYGDLAKPDVLFTEFVRVKPNAKRVIAETDYIEATTRVPCLLYTSPSPRDLSTSRMPSSA